MPWWDPSEPISVERAIRLRWLRGVTLKLLSAKTCMKLNKASTPQASYNWKRTNMARRCRKKSRVILVPTNHPCRSNKSQCWSRETTQLKVAAVSWCTPKLNKPGVAMETTRWKQRRQLCLRNATKVFTPGMNTSLTSLLKELIPMVLSSLCFSSDNQFLKELQPWATELMQPKWLVAVQHLFSKVSWLNKALPRDNQLQL